MTQKNSRENLLPKVKSMPAGADSLSRKNKNLSQQESTRNHIEDIKQLIDSMKSYLRKDERTSR